MGRDRGSRSAAAVALLLVTGFALALPGLARAEAAPPATDPAADTSTTTDPAADTTTDPTAAGPTTDPAADTTTNPPADAATNTTGTTDPAASPTDPAQTTAPTAPPAVTTDGAPVACTPAATADTSTSATPETVCPTLVLVETAEPAPAPAPPPAQQHPPPQAPAPAQQPVLAPATETIVTPVGADASEAMPVLTPLHGGLGAQRPPSLSATAPKAKADSPLLAEERAAPVLAVEPAAPVLAVVPDALPELALVPPPTIVDRALPEAGLGGAALRPLLEHSVISPTPAAAPGPDSSSSEPGGGRASTGGDEPLPLFPPQDPSESPTGLGAPSSGGGAHGATGVFAILTAFLLLFVPRIVRRLRPASSLVPLVGYRVVLERPG